jgi:serine/threonine-protein kinase
MQAAGHDEPSLIGSTLCDTYRLTAKLGVGAMGTVYDAEHVRLKLNVAVKILAAKYRDHLAAIKRFHNEARALVMLDSAHVVRILDFAISVDGRPFLVMERLHGATVAAHLERKRSFSVSATMAVAHDVCEALVEAHSKGVFHRDLKPENLFLVDTATRKEFIKVLDFGISRVPDPGGERVTSEREVIGTPEYMSPEQALGLSDRVNGRADQHGLALVMYEMLSGVSPFAAATVDEALEKVSFEMPALVDTVAKAVPHGLALVLHRALSKDPQERFPGIDDFLNAAQYAVKESAPRSIIPIDRPETRASTPVSKTNGSDDPLRTVALLLSRTRASLLAGDAIGASKLAGTALDAAALANDEAVNAIIELARPLLEGVFQSRLEPVDRRIRLHADRLVSDPPFTASQVALIRAKTPNATIAEVLGAIALPRLDALRALAELEARGVLEFVTSPRPRSQAAPSGGPSRPPVSHRAPLILKRA